MYLHDASYVWTQLAVSSISWRAVRRHCRSLLTVSHISWSTSQSQSRTSCCLWTWSWRTWLCRYSSPWCSCRFWACENWTSCLPNTCKHAHTHKIYVTMAHGGLFYNTKHHKRPTILHNFYPVNNLVTFIYCNVSTGKMMIGASSFDDKQKQRDVVNMFTNHLQPGTGYMHWQSLISN